MTSPIQVNPNSQIYSRPNIGQRNTAVSGSSFADELDKVQELKFSNHAQKRLENRNITITDDGMARLINAVDKAEKRGGKESLVLMDEMAFIVNVKDRVVVTAMDARSGGEGVFTQIDTVVLANKAEARATETLGA